MSDARAVTELVAACELHDDGQIEIDESDILTDRRTPSLDLAAHSVGVRAGENLVAYGHVFKFRRAEVYVHPEHRGRGIGSSLIRWTWDIARSGGGTLVGQMVTDNDLGAADLFRALGYEPFWFPGFSRSSPPIDRSSARLPTTSRPGLHARAGRARGVRRHREGRRARPLRWSGRSVRQLPRCGLRPRQRSTGCPAQPAPP